MLLPYQIYHYLDVFGSQRFQYVVMQGLPVTARPISSLSAPHGTTIGPSNSFAAANFCSKTHFSTRPRQKQTELIPEHLLITHFMERDWKYCRASSSGGFKMSYFCHSLPGIARFSCTGAGPLLIL